MGLLPRVGPFKAGSPSLPPAMFFAAMSTGVLWLFAHEISGVVKARKFDLPLPSIVTALDSVLLPQGGVRVALVDDSLAVSVFDINVDLKKSILPQFVAEFQAAPPPCAL